MEREGVATPPGGLTAEYCMNCGGQNLRRRNQRVTNRESETVASGTNSFVHWGEVVEHHVETAADLAAVGVADVGDFGRPLFVFRLDLGELGQVLEIAVDAQSRAIVDEHALV